MASVRYTPGVSRSQLRRVRQRVRDAFPPQFFYAIPNHVPYNAMLLLDLLKLGECGVKTRNWTWHHRGPVLLYNSSKVARQQMRAYGFDIEDPIFGPEEAPLLTPKAIVGIANLVDVRSLTDDEKAQLVILFNNLRAEDTLRIARLRGKEFDKAMAALGWPLPIGFFFKDLRPFPQPVLWTPKSGSVRVLHVPFSVIAPSLQAIGYSLPR